MKSLGHLQKTCFCASSLLHENGIYIRYCLHNRFIDSDLTLVNEPDVSSFYTPGHEINETFNVFLGL
jgi:hypothetical protein